MPGAKKRKKTAPQRETNVTEESKRHRSQESIVKFMQRLMVVPNALGLYYECEKMH